MELLHTTSLRHEPRPEAADLDRKQPVAADAVRVERTCRIAVRAAARSKGKRSCRGSTRRACGSRADDRAEDVRVSAEHDLRPAARHAEANSACVRPAPVQLDAPVQEADDEVGAAVRGANVGDRPRIGPRRTGCVASR